MIKFFWGITLPFALVACGMENISLPISTPFNPPSPQPAILSPTSQFVPTAISTIIIFSVSPTNTITPSFTPSVTLTEIPTSTAISTSTSTFTPTTGSTQSTSLGVDIIGCNTSIDILHQMGEVTNAFPVIRNTSGKKLTNVCATLSASDEGRVHPDKTACVTLLPDGYEVIFKLTVDTTTGKDTSIQVVVNTYEGLIATVSQPSCRDLGLPGRLPTNIGEIKPIS